MSNFKLEEIPVKDMQALGLHDGRKFLVDKKTLGTLLTGRISDFVHMDNVKIEKGTNVSLDAKLSMRRKPDGTAGLFVHPIYRDLKDHPDLNTEENHAFSRGGVHSKKIADYGKILSFGETPYNFEKDNKQSFYIELEKKNGEKKHIWGVGLKDALEKSGFKKGNDVQLAMTGKQQVNTLDKDGKWITTDRLEWDIKPFDEARKQEKTVIYEFDQETKSFVSLPEDYVQKMEEINGMPLSEDQKKKFKEGKEVEMQDGTTVQVSPASKDHIRTDKRMLIFSVLMDGGLSFMLYKGLRAIEKRNEKKQQRENQYSKGYADALVKVQAELEKKQAMSPNDKTIASDINIVKQ